MNSFSEKDFEKILNSLTLLFKNKALEKGYRDSCKKEALSFIRYVLVISIFFYGIFALLDSYLLPHFKIYLWVIRFILVLPLALLLIVVSGLNTFQKNMYLFLSIFSIISGIGIIAMIAISPPPVSSYYYAALILILILNYNFLKLPFLLATANGVLLVVLYELTVIYIQPITQIDFVSNSFFLINANFFCMFSNYLIEYNNRRNYFLKYILDEQNKKINLINENLEDEVKKHTAELQTAYDKLRSSELYHRHILENLGEGVAIVDLNENFTFANASADKIFGVDSGKLISRNLIEFTTAESLQTIQAEAENINSGKSVEYEIEIMKECGNNSFISVTAKPEFNDNNEIIGILGIYRDISKRKKIEDEMKLRLDYELLLSSISHRFFGVYQFSESVLETLAEFGDFIKADYVFLFELDNVNKLIRKRYNWTTLEKKPETEDICELSLDQIPVIISYMQKNLILDFNQEADLMLRAESEILFQLNGSNCILIPVIVNQELRALSGFTYQSEECLWSEKYLSLVKVLADIFGYAYERQSYELLIKNQLEEKESLLKEIHHRVKNNMQIITSIIRLQTRFLSNIDIDEILVNFQNRMQTMTQAYNKVFLSGSFTRINFENYLSSLIIDLYYSLKISERNVELETDIAPVDLDINIVVPLGLIINEILTNSIKHAFPDNKGGIIKIDFKEMQKEEYFLQIADNGIGISENFNFVQSDTLGSLLINILSEQIKADTKIENINGTVFTLTFSNLLLKTFSEI
jgi:PAS domain S-box-containing protein